jgi:folate-dependent phosphoribosylglycinamide formyltransferase PurN
MSNLDKYWEACYSSSGREIYEISKRLGRFPDRIITNQKDISKTIPELLAVCEKENIDFVQVINPTIEDYRELFLPESLISLHGWSKILPAEICEENLVLNVHPGNTRPRKYLTSLLIDHTGYYGNKMFVADNPTITDIPVIIGKDPQKKALEIRAPYTGVTIHVCSTELDLGEVLAFKEVKNKYVNEFLTEEVLNKFINELRQVSIDLWIPILQEKLCVTYS